METTNYFIIGVIAVIGIFAIAIGVEKMIKVIVGNYILSIICLAANHTIDLGIGTLTTLQISKGASVDYSQILSLLLTGKIGIVLTLYLFLLVIVFTKSKIHISTDHLPFPKLVTTCILVVMTIISVLLTLGIVVRGVKIIDPSQLLVVASDFSKYNIIYQILLYTPLWVLIHGLTTLYLISELKGGGSDHHH